MRRLILAALVVAAATLGASAVAVAPAVAQQNCDSSYPDFCIPPKPPDLNCPDIGVANFTANPPDPHGFDADNDRTGCDDASKGRDAITNPNGIGAKALAGQTTATTTATTTPATTAATQAPVVAAPTTSTPAVQSTTPTSAMPRTGAAEDRAAILGFGIVVLGVVAVWWARPRLVAAFAQTRFIDQERIDRASKVLGWSEPWDEHLRRRPRDRSN